MIPLPIFLFFFFHFSHQTDNSIIHPALEGEEKTIEVKAIAGELDTIPASVTKFVCDTRQVRLQKWLACVVLFWKPGNRHKLFCRSYSVLMDVIQLSGSCASKMECDAAL